MAAVHFDASDQSRFLVAYAALEELGADPEELKGLGLEPAGRSSAYLAALERLVGHLDAIEADPDREAKRELRDGLLHLRNVQATGRCRKLVRDVLGDEAVGRFSTLTRVGTDIAHKGLSPPAGGSLSYEAYHLARDLLFGTTARQRPRPVQGRGQRRRRGALHHRGLDLEVSTALT